MTEDTLKNNPLLCRDGLPPFDAIKPAHVLPAVRHLLAEAERQFAELEANLVPSWEGLLRPLETLDRPFEYGWKPVSHLLGVKNSPELREAYDAVLPEVVQFSLRVRQSPAVYEALKAIRDGEEWARLTEPQQRVVQAQLLCAELAGIGLEPPERERFNANVQQLSQLGTDFANHVLDATKAYALVLTEPDEIAGLPESLLQLAADSYNADESRPADAPEATAESGPWRITLEAPSFGPFLQHGRRRDLREQIYRAFITRASSGELDNSEIIQQLLRLRREQAQLLGYANFAEMSLAQKMAPGVAAIEQMFDTLREASWEPAVRDLKDVQELAASNGATAELAHWDIAFWAERLREQRYDYTDEQVRPYFPLDRVLEGLFALCERLFGIRIAAADGAPVWHPDVRFFHVLDGDATHIASFYLDPYSRPANKRGGAWMNECLVRCRVGETLQLPVAHLVCNGTPPGKNRPSLMTFREVETLFHEFGHGLQHMLTTVEEADASGINGIEWDAVELPSQFMENWCYHRPTLLSISGHYQTGEPLPEDLFEKIRAARTYRSGSMMLRQLQFGMTDMELHTHFDPDGDETPFDVQRKISRRTSVMPALPEDRSLCAFQHIFGGGYAAGYYSYKWAEVLSADAFSAFEEAGLDDEQAVAETGRRFRKTILSLGGGKHPMDVFREFRGREPDPAPLLRHHGLL